MPKKKNCRRTPQERETHDRAVALRKMTDEKLVGYIDRQYAAGVDAGRISNEIAAQDTAKEILEAIKSTKGIGAATFSKIETAVWEILNPCTGCTLEHHCYVSDSLKQHECSKYSKYLEDKT